MAELKPCPFCGGEAFIYYSGSPSNGSFAEVICRECKCQTLRLRGDKAIEAWNRRHEPSQELEFDYGAEVE